MGVEAGGAMTQAGWSDLFDLVHESIFVRDPEGRILSWNAASEKLYGWSPDEAVGRDAGDLLGTRADIPLDEVETTLRATGTWEGRLRRRTARGEERVIEARLSVRRNAEGGPVEVVEIGADLTERLKTQTALAAAERRYTNLFQAMAAAFWELDFAPVGEMLRALRKQGVTDLSRYFAENPAFVRDMMRATRILDVNEETVKLFGGGDKGLMRGSVEPFWPEASAMVYAASVVAAVSGAPSFSTETRLRRANGEEFDALFTACFAPEAVGRGTLLIGVIDISERVQALRALKAREASHRYLFDYMPVSLWQIDSQELAPFYVEAKALGVTDFDAYLQAHPGLFEQMLAGLRCEGVNPKTLELFGGSDVSEFLGPIAYFWRQRPDSLRRSMAARYNGASHHTEETQLRTLDGREIEVLYVITWPTGVAEGRSGIAGIVDITERVRAQRAERRLQDEFAHSARISMLGELTASIAHEVNQPLAAIGTNAAASLRWLGRERPDVERALDLTDRIVGDVRRAADIIDRVRAMASNRPTARAALSLASVIEEAAAFLRHELQGAGVSLHLALDRDAAPVLADRTQLQQVFVNLALNAAQAMAQAQSANRRLEIRLREADDRWLRVEVEDTGPGLPADAADQVFESFFTTKAAGMGMGLPISRSIVEQHGGRIQASQVVGGGAMFTVMLPAQQSAEVG